MESNNVVMTDRAGEWAGSSVGLRVDGACGSVPSRPATGSLDYAPDADAPL
jgi:hypothetical protein